MAQKKETTLSFLFTPYQLVSTVEVELLTVMVIL